MLGAGCKMKRLRCGQRCWDRAGPARSGARAEEARNWSQRIGPETNPALAGSDAAQEPGLSRAARAYRRRIDATPVHRLLLRLVPKHDAFQRSFVRLTPQTLKAVNDLVVEAAVELGLEDGAKLRVDTTVVQTDIHHSTDNTLLWDVVRVVTRLVGRLAKALELRRIKGFCDRRRSARRRMYEIQRMTTRQSDEQQARTYRVLITIAEEVVGKARVALEKTGKMRGRDLLAEMAIEELRRQIEHFCQLGSRVIDQARRRALDSEQVPNSEKIYSIFEPHTDLIKRGKVRTPVEFGHKVFLAESAQGLITQYQVLRGNPSDDIYVAPSLRRHRQAFGGLRNYTARIAASSANKISPPAGELGSRWCAFPSAAAPGPRSARRTKAAWSSSKGSASAPDDISAATFPRNKSAAAHPVARPQGLILCLNPTAENSPAPALSRLADPANLRPIYRHNLDCIHQSTCFATETRL